MHVWMMVPKWLYDMISYLIIFDLIWWVWWYDKYDDISIWRYDMMLTTLLQWLLWISHDDDNGDDDDDDDDYFIQWKENIKS